MNPLGVKSGSLPLDELKKVDKVIIYPVEPKLITDDEGVIRYRIGRNAFRKLAEEANAVVMLGRSRRSNVTKIDSYLDSISGC
ncbi:MAG: hypothetical protein HFI13_10970 [Lachnospiraceae bacterium]|nr:hypothetical protein [Lachnospiraceae bacterium]